MSISARLVEGARTFISVGSVLFLFARVGWLGESQVDLYREDIKLGCFNHIFYDVAKFKLAGEDKVTECWSITPIRFKENTSIQRKH